MIGAIIQARMTSTRFPGKMAVDLNNYSLIEWVIRRVMLSKRIDKIILAIPKSKKSDFFFDLKSKYPIEIFTGDEFNLCKRFNGVISKSDQQMAPQQDKKVDFVTSKAECGHLTGAKFITKLFPAVA